MGKWDWMAARARLLSQTLSKEGEMIGGTDDTQDRMNSIDPGIDPKLDAVPDEDKRENLL